MGNCCSNGDDAVDSKAHSRKSSKPFQGEGHRLGTVHDGTNNRNSASHAAAAEKEEIPQPIVNSNISDADREQQRKERIAAAEARIKKQGLPVNPKKKKVDPNAPLVGPNSKPAMTWQL